jgi:hypothetical protein
MLASKQWLVDEGDKMVKETEEQKRGSNQSAS